jgi:hypothetical protein
VEEPGWKSLHGANLSRRRDRLDEASRDRADRLVGECRDQLVRAVRYISGGCRQRNTELGLLLSGGVDSCAILEACSLAGAPLTRAVTISIVDDPDQIPEDERYATEAVEAYNERNGNGNQSLAHTIVRMSPAQLVKDHSSLVIRTLAVWGYMETRNSLVMSAGFAACRELDLSDILLGDNADELLGGSYDWYFNQRYEDHPEEWIAKRNASADLPFATSHIADAYDLIAHQPFRIPPLVEWATESTTRTDCIDVHGSCLLKDTWGGPSTNEHNCGKLPLREAFCTVASWRTMDWIFKGSGAAGSGGLVTHYETIFSDEDFELEQARYLLEEGVRLQTKEHLHNIRVYEKIFGGLRHPTKARYPNGDPRGCVSCRFDHENEDFCRLCDEYPARQKPASTEGGTAVP